MQIVLGEVAVEKITKGRNKWEVATVNYTQNGETRQQKIVSFSNPEVFKQVQELPAGSNLDVEVTKNDNGYNQWARIQVMSAASAQSTAKGAVTGVRCLAPSMRLVKNAR